MGLKTVYDSLEDIPEAYQDLFTEKGGKFELTGVDGIKTSADTERLQMSLGKEREAHKATKAKLQVWGELNPEDVHTKLDRLPELEALAKGKLDDTQIEEIVTRRVEGTLRSKLSPLERQLKQLEKEREELAQQNQQFAQADRTRRIHDNVRKALVESKVVNTAQEDALLLADRVFEIREDDGAIVTRDSVGVTPGLDPAAWLSEIQDRRPHWWPDSVGGGAQGSIGGGGRGVKNPWSAEYWNLTRQGQFLREHGDDRAAAMAKAAGTTLGGGKPAAKART